MIVFSGNVRRGQDRNHTGGRAYLTQIQAADPVSVRAEVRPTRDSWSLDAVPGSQDTAFSQPHVEWNGVYTTRLVVVNTSPTASRSVRFQRRSPAGVAVGTIRAASGAASSGRPVIL